MLVMDRPRFREVLDSIPSYKPGRPPAPGALSSYKLSSNENPYPPLPGVMDAVMRAAASMNRYPDMAVVELHARLADKYGVVVDQVATGTGSVALLYHALQASCVEGDEVVYAWRSFEAYPIAVGLSGATGVTVPLTAGARHDLPAMAAAITDATRVVVVCTPNNPTGPAVHRAEFDDFLAAVPSRVLVVVDEAYREFVTDPDVADALTPAKERANVVVLRTFSKAYGLAGLRVGYAVGPAPVIDAIRKCSLPFGVSSIAQVAAAASLDVEPALLDRVDALVRERGRVVNGLADQGFAVPDAQGNFVWLPLGDRAVEFGGFAQDRGVAVRPFDGDGVRVTVGEPAANDRFLEITAEWRAEGEPTAAAPEYATTF